MKLLAPAEPNKVVAAGLNYRSHIGQAAPATYVGLFAKYPTTLTGHESPIIYPADATDVHYEAEICVVIGKKAQNITEAEARSHIFGVTPCNDVSERAWQKQDLQWFRAKAADTFGPMGPALVTNVDDNTLKLIGRLNGKVVQETTADLLIFPIDHIVSDVSRYVTLGDVIFTGTPGTTQAMKAGGHLRGGDTRRRHAPQPRGGGQGRRIAAVDGHGPGGITARASERSRGRSRRQAPRSPGPWRPAVRSGAARDRSSGCSPPCPARAGLDGR